IDRLNLPDGPLAVEARKRGLDGALRLRQVYDQTVYIDDALELVQSNIWVGGALAILVLILFLRSLISAGIIALAIPISVMGAIVAMVALGRNINVISLAGMAFAVGMVVDNAIVVLENIYRHLEMGKPPMKAARDGSLEVWGAVLAATLTTVVVFVPILLIEDEAGQLFRDIALAICAAVSLSLLVSVTVIPACAGRLLRSKRYRETHPSVWRSIFDTVASPLAWVPGTLGNLTYAICGSWLFRILGVVVLTAVSVIGTSVLIPPTDYLPTGNRNLVFGMLIPPAGYSLEQQGDIAGRIEETVSPFFDAGRNPIDSAEYEEAKVDLPEIPVMNPMTGQSMGDVTPPPLENYFIVSIEGMMFHGGIATEPQRVADLKTLFQFATRPQVVPGVFAFAFQVPLFRLGGRTGSAVKINFSGADLDAVTRAAGAFFMALMGTYGPGTVQPNPSNFNVPGPELRVLPNRIRLAQAGLTPDDVGLAVQARGDGAIIGEYRIGSDTIDLKLIAADSVGQQFIGNMGDLPLATPDGRVVPLESVAQLASVAVPQQINRVGRQRAVTLEFTAPEGLALEEAVRTIDKMIEQQRATGAIPESVETSYTGSASKLASVQRAMFGDGTWMGLLNSSMVQALLVVYLLMCVLFQSFMRPLVIMFSVPLATFGGFLALRLVHDASAADPYMPTQNLDILTMLGFLILVGVVVNNAILIVHQSLNFMRGAADEGSEEPMEPRRAIAEAVRTRVRPIFMSTLTSVGGMAPLVFAPGSGSELYRGLGSVVIGGLIVSTIFTLLLVPLLFSLVTDAQALLARWWGREDTVVAGLGGTTAALLLAASLAVALSGCSFGESRDPSHTDRWLRETVEDTLGNELRGEPRRWKPAPRDEELLEAVASRRDELENMGGPSSYAAPTTFEGTDLTGEKPSVVEINRAGAIFEALRNNLDLETGRLDRQIAEHGLVIAEAEFDPLLFANFDFTKIDEPRAVPVLNGVALGTGVTANETESIEAGVRLRSNEWGGTATLSGYLDRYENDVPGGFTLRPDPSYNARIGLELRQPLWRGFGSDATRAQIRLAKNERDRARENFYLDVVTLVSEVENAYWDLVLAHRTLAIRERLLERGEAVRDVLQLRLERDADRAQFADALAVVETRRADRLRAQVLVQRATDRLKFWMNHREHPLQGETVLIPVETLEVEPRGYDLIESIRSALDRRPEVRLSIAAIEDGEVRKELAQSLVGPRLDLTAGISYRGLDDRWYDAIGQLEPDDFVSYAVGLMFELPFGNRAAEAELDRRSLELRRSVTDARRIVRDVILDVKDSLRGMKESADLIAASRDARLAQTENLRALLAEKQTRSALTPEFLDLEFSRQERLALAEIAEVIALTEYRKAVANVERALAVGVRGRLAEEYL
ncbi:MAG: efflux RND transporter permease subunit, partial [Planctomycetes bacterium]|nr:efflux RND transporter permease subunit [Planctomycetota bacterium]